MQADKVKLICTGDVHLGRHPSRIPEELDDQRFSPKSIWQSTVEEADRRNVDAVVVSGDVIDRENRYFEAYGAFEAGIARLEEVDIPVVVVAGNHDYDVLPRLVRELNHDNLHLIGEGGNWERWTLKRDDEERLHVDGWSFPTEHVIDTPLDAYDLPPVSDTPVLGLLHADLDTPGSEYAPVESNDILDKPVDAWILGHIHKPTIHNEGNPLVFYPGSPQALDPGERGVHGPWAVSIDDTGSVAAEQIPLATVRYSHFEAELSEATDSKSIPSIVSAEVEDRIRSDVGMGAVDLLLARVRLTGRTSAHTEIHRQRERIERDASFKAGTTDIRVESIEVHTRPAIDLSELAKGESPAAYVAELLLAIENGDVTEEYSSLVQDSLGSIQQAQNASPYRELRRQGELEVPNDADAVETLETQARLLLDTLLEQKEGST